MKGKTIVFSTLFCVASSMSFSANASIEAALANICNIVKTDDKSELRKKMKSVRNDFKLKLGDYYEGISCNGNSLIRTALLSEALNTGTLLVKKMPKSKLNKPEVDGIKLSDWIAQKGLDSSPIAQVVSERL
ncbi:DUF3718 domain-containing protein [Agaribacter marinus]|uniref:DUF3718 domain-containing protein n=1 Tax=Agaribacter marinus TaxID=1431249 RepID=A0AA37SX42_9ALTE|nr:DUF3718 domain-containing protein [Agaribacter marinus]GLR69765.1 hypothetical protein GCM10007852_06730 [Agaribacter marinus]